MMMNFDVFLDVIQTGWSDLQEKKKHIPRCVQDLLPGVSLRILNATGNVLRKRKSF